MHGRNTLVGAACDLWIGGTSGPNQKQFVLDDPKAVTDHSD